MTPHRDLGRPEPWQRSIERSLHRRRIAPQVRRTIARRRRASAALTTLMVAGPTGSALAAVGTGAGSAGWGSGASAALDEASPATRAIGGAATMLRLGSSGNAVAEVQRELEVAVDGIFGPVTDAAVRDFQTRSGLLVDGIVGPATWTALFGLGAAAAAAGAANGDVAVIVREHPAATAASEVGANRAAPGSVALGGDDAPVGDDISVGGPSLQAPGGNPAPEANAQGDPAHGGPPAPRTIPVSTPAPAAGACGSLRLGSPVRGTVTSGFGPRWGRNHDGIDIAAPTGTPIRAAECGVVSFSGVQSGYGNMVCVKHSSRFETCYAHMSRRAAAGGQRVAKGEVIGYVGCTGSCTGPHLHFETRVDGGARDPRPYLAGGSVPGAPTVATAASSPRGATATNAGRGTTTASTASGATGRAVPSVGDGATGGVAAPSSQIETTDAPTSAPPAPAPPATQPPPQPEPAAPAEPEPSSTAPVPTIEPPPEPAPAPMPVPPPAPTEPEPVEPEPAPEPQPVESGVEVGAEEVVPEEAVAPAPTGTP
jgi:murein DD-endopeptidase MepM/ murein hydrolase activator NlpD